MWCSRISSRTGFSLSGSTRERRRFALGKIHELVVRMFARTGEGRVLGARGCMAGIVRKLWARNCGLSGGCENPQTEQAAEKVGSRRVSVAQPLLAVRFSRWIASRMRESPENRTAKSGCATQTCRAAFGILFLFAVLPARATTYYVDNCVTVGSDSNNGTSTSTPWLSVAHVNAQSFNPGDSVLFERSCAWYGTALTVPSSGSSGSPITFGAYGSGANPILRGSTLLNTSGYVLDTGITSAPIYGPLLDSGTSSSDSGTRNWRFQIAHANLTAGATAITITVTAEPGAALNITGAGIGPVTTAPNTSSITRITWGGGNNGVTVPAGTSVTSDQITYALSNSVDQIVTVYTTARNVEYYVRQLGDALWSDFTASDQSQIANVTGDGFATNGGSIVSNITSINPPIYVYYAALGSTPLAVWENDVLMKLVASAALVEGNANSWYYDGTSLYLHASDNSNVATNGKTYSYYTSSSPTYTMWDNGKNYLVINGIDQAETYNTSTATLGGLYLTGSHSLVENLAVHDVYRHGFCFYLTAAGNTAINIAAYNSYGTAPICIYGTGTIGNVLQNSTIYQDTFYSTTYVSPGPWGIIVAHGGSTANVIDSCVIYSTASRPVGFAILDGDSGTTLTASHNLIYGPLLDALNVGSGGGFLGAGSNITFFGNAVDTSQEGGVGIQFNASTGSVVYNNAFYGPANTNAAISQASTSTGTLVKNNIFYTGAYASVDASSETGTAYDYNIYFSASGTPFSWGGTAYTLAGWQTNSSEDAHSFSSDPLFTSAAPIPSGGDYSPLAISPAIGAGVNLGSAYQMDLSPASTWPAGVTLFNQNTTSGGWEIGAYVYQQNGSTRLLRGCCD
jgi:hypothetical protein